MLRVRSYGTIFSQMIEAGHHARITALAGSGNCLLQRFAGDKAACHAARRAIGSDPIGEFFAFGELQKCRPEHAASIMAAQAERKLVPFQLFSTAVSLAT